MPQGRTNTYTLKLFLFTSAFALVAVGCVSSPPAQRWSSHPSPETAPPQSPAPESQGDRNVARQSSLAALAAFLERTEEYSMPSSSGETASANDDSEFGSKQRLENQGYSDASSMKKMGISTGIETNHPWTASANAEMSVLQQPQHKTAPPPPVIQSVNIAHPKVLEAPARIESQQTNTTNLALSVADSSDGDIEEKLFTRLTSDWKKSPNFDATWRLRWTQVAFGRSADSAYTGSDLSADSTALFDALIRTAASLRSAIRNPVLPADEALANADQLKLLLSERADPTITDVQLCQKVVTYGVYEPLDTSNLIAGRTNQAIVYVEVKNFRSEKMEDQYRTALSSRLEVLTTDGKSVWEHEEPEIEDHCRRRRSDFFIAQRIALPPTLAPGNYVLKVLVDDRLAGRADEASHRFTLHAATSLAGAP